MRFNIIVVTACLLALAAAQTYELVWSDEFNGNSLDLTKWQYEVNCDGGGNAELECYTSSANNVKVTNGSLVITAIPQSYNGKQYTSGRLNTAASAAWKYGKIEFNAKLPNGIYLWPALWMMPRDSVYGSWAASGEIDIMESKSTQNTQESTLHYGGAWPNNIYQGSGAQTMTFDTTAAYHTYGVIWTETSMQFLIDENVYYTQSLERNFWSGIGTDPYTANGQPFDQYFYIIINLAVGGGFFGSDAASLTTAQANAWANPSLYVDYVRVYQLTSSSVVSPVTPVASTTSLTCSTMYANLTCRTTSEDVTQLDASSILNARNWLCSNYPQFCTAIQTGGTYASCNTVEQLSYAMNLYYAQFSSQGSGACNFGGLGQVVSSNVAATKAATTSSTVAATKAATTSSTVAATTAAASSTSCSAMWNTLSCRTSSEVVSQVDATAVASSRTWLCATYPQYCTDIVTGGTYAGCNSVEQLSYAMSKYYNAFGASQGASACSFGGIGNVIVAAAAKSSTTSSTTSAAAAATSSGSSGSCAKASYCSSTMCACNGACYSPDSYCCVNNNLTQKQFC